MQVETLNIQNLVRSAVVLVVGLPVALSAGSLINTAGQVASQQGLDPTVKPTKQLKAKLAEPCLRYMLSKNDSKLEREAKNDIDEVVGGPVNYQQTCNWAL